MEKREEHFVLVHGACHGAWCWYKVATLLKSAGHRVTALDMAAAGIHPKQPHELHSNLDYSEPLMEFMASLPREERVILVGHSMGGVCISLALESFPDKVSVAVFATALMPGPDLTLKRITERVTGRLDSYMDSELTFGNGPSNHPTAILFGSNYMSSKLYQLSPPEDLKLALTLKRPARLFSDADLQNEAMITNERYGSVHRVYVVCEPDNVMDEDIQRWMIENNPTDEVKLISGSDHMIMFSKPHELCSCLLEIAAKYP